MRLIVNFLLGALFGLGLEISGMTYPSKVKGFLDVAGNWDPSLAFVMAGAIGIGFVAFRLAATRQTSLFGDTIALRRSLAVDKTLLIGAAIFGIGWGISGVCPGPAIVNLGFFDPHTMLFVAAMVGGMALEQILFGGLTVEDDLASTSQRP